MLLCRLYQICKFFELNAVNKFIAIVALYLKKVARCHSSSLSSFFFSLNSIKKNIRWVLHGDSYSHKLFLRTSIQNVLFFSDRLSLSWDINLLLHMNFIENYYVSGLLAFETIGKHYSVLVLVEDWAQAGWALLEPYH